MADTLHAIAMEAAKDFGCKAWNTDGGVMPATQADGFIRHLHADWGLLSSVRAMGKGVVHGPSSYRIGDTVGRYTKSTSFRGNRRNMDPDHVAILKNARLSFGKNIL
jgi:hypothetical protein